MAESDVESDCLIVGSNPYAIIGNEIGPHFGGAVFITGGEGGIDSRPGTGAHPCGARCARPKSLRDFVDPTCQIVGSNPMTGIYLNLAERVGFEPTIRY